MQIFISDQIIELVYFNNSKSSSICSPQCTDSYNQEGLCSEKYKSTIISYYFHNYRFFFVAILN